MAANATEMNARWRRLSGYLVKPGPERWEFTIRLALICTLTTLLTEIYQTPEPALTAYIAFFLNRPERTLSLILGVALTVLISMVIGLVFLVAKVVTDDSLLRVLSIAVMSVALLFLASASKLRPIAGTVALIVGYALDLLGTVQVGEEATRALLYAWLFVAIPGGVSLIINLTVAPNPKCAVEQALSKRLQVCAAQLRDPDKTSTRESLQEFAYQGVASLEEQLKLAGAEKSIPPRDLAALQHALLSTTALMAALQVLQSSPHIHLPPELRNAIAATLDEMATILASGGYPVEITAVAWPALANPARADEAALLASLRQALVGFAQPSQPPAPPIPSTPAEGFFLADAFTNPEHVHFALKTSAAAVFCYCLYSLLDWPGIHTCFLTCYIVAQATAAESVEKLALRIVGCLAGAAAGIATLVYLIPFLTSIGGLMLAVFAGAIIAAYIAAGSPRISYAGFQFAFAFFLCVIQGAGPAFDLTIARDRIIGILIGNLVAYIVLVHIWPMSVGARIDPALASVTSRLRQLFLTKRSDAPAHGDEPARIAVQVTATLASAETDLALARYEPISIRASNDWLHSRVAFIERARWLCQRLLIGLQHDSLHRAVLDANLSQLEQALPSPPSNTDGDPHAAH